MTTIPTRQQLYDTRIGDLENELDITIPDYGRNFLRADSAVEADVQKMLWLSIANAQKNMFPDLAEPEAQGGTLERAGKIKLGRRPFPATQAQYTANVTGTAAAVIPAGQTFKSDDDSLNPNMLFICDAGFTLIGSSGSITVRALTAGIVSRLEVGNTLTATSPMPLVDSAIVIAAETIAPRAAETTEEYRTKVLEAYRIETQGGARGDYRLWGYDAQGVHQIYPYAVSGNNNEINVFVEATIADSTDGNGTPTMTILNDVSAAIEQSPDTTLSLAERSRRPLGVFEVHVLPIVPLEVDIDIADFLDITTEKQAIIEEAIDEALYDIRPFIDGLDPVSGKNDVLDTYRIGRVILDVLPGSSFGAITMTVDGTPVSTYTFDNGELGYRGTITYS